MRNPPKTSIWWTRYSKNISPSIKPLTKFTAFKRGAKKILRGHKSKRSQPKFRRKVKDAGWWSFLCQLALGTVLFIQTNTNLGITVKALCCCCLVAKSCPTLCNPIHCSLQASPFMGFSSKNTEVGCHFLLQGIFLTQGSNMGLLL